ncbi:MAG: M24 family metallopeptidase [Nitrospinota bacterium]
MVEMEGRGTPGPEIRERLERARRAMAERGLDALFVIGRSFYDRLGDLAYLSNHFPPFPAGTFTKESRGAGHGVLILPAEGAPVLLVDRTGYRRDIVPIEDVRITSNIAPTVKEVLADRRLTAARVGIVGEDILPLALYRDLTEALPGVAWEPADAAVRGLRAVKTEAEIALLRKAAEIADRSQAAALAACAPGRTEADVCAAAIAEGMRRGADFVRYVRVHSGPWSTWGIRWPQATMRVLREGDVVRIDVIGAFEGYQYDVLRTTVLGRPSEEVLKILEVCAEATERAVEAVRPGARSREIYETAQVVFEREGYGAHSRVFMGHGIGLETVEAPLIQKGLQDVIEEGMVLCIEPGLSVPDVAGACIEEEVIVRKDGPELITRAPTRPWRSAG